MMGLEPGIDDQWAGAAPVLLENGGADAMDISGRV